MWMCFIGCFKPVKCEYIYTHVIIISHRYYSNLNGTIQKKHIFTFFFFKRWSVLFIVAIIYFYFFVKQLTLSLIRGLCGYCVLYDGTSAPIYVQSFI